MTNEGFNKSKEEKRQMFFDMLEHPDRYTDEQVERLLADEDVKDFFHKTKTLKQNLEILNAFERIQITEVDGILKVE